MPIDPNRPPIRGGWTKTGEGKNPPKPFVEKAESTVGEPQDPPVLKSRAGRPKCGAPKAWTGF